MRNNLQKVWNKPVEFKKGLCGAHFNIWKKWLTKSVVKTLYKTMVILFLQAEGEIWEPNDYEVCKCSNGKQKCSERCPLEMKCKKVMQALYNLKKFSKNFNTTGYLLVGWNWRPLSILSVRGLAACKQEKNQIARIYVVRSQFLILDLQPI